jgi:hypothetical protein
MTVFRLNDAQRSFVVQALASFETPEAVAAAVNKEFGIKISRQAIEQYDPTKRAGAGCAAKWKVLFEETRKAFLEDTARIGVSHKAVRLRALDRMAAKAEGMGAIGLAAQLLEQAAKETGGALTNRRELTGADGAPLASPTVIFELPNNDR